MIPRFQTIETINNSIIFSAAASAEPICFKITLILLTMRNALLPGICPSFLQLIQCHRPLVPPAGKYENCDESQSGYFPLEEQSKL